jgi:hypothetical protein
MSEHLAAYGFRVVGIGDRQALTVHGAGSWPVLRVERRIEGDHAPPELRVTEHAASLQTPAAHLLLERATGRVTIVSRAPVSEADLVHPCLWPAAAVFARWLGAETFHAGAFVDADGCAWALVGDRGAGKSSLLAGMALAGDHVVADDLLVVRGRECFAGPRCLDLRPEAVASLGVGQDTSPVRSTERWRLALRPSDGSFPLHGFVYLAWGESIAVARMIPGEHFGLLTRHRRVAALGVDFDQLFDLAELPALCLTRPTAWSSLPGAREAVIEAVRRIAR